MEKRVFLAVGLCVAVFLAWQRFYMDPILESQRQYQVSQATSVGLAQNKATSPLIVGSPTQSAFSSATQVLKEQTKVKTSGPKLISLGATKSGVVGKLHLSLDEKTAAFVSPDMEEYQGHKVTGVGKLISEGPQATLRVTSPEWAYLNGVEYTQVDGPKYESLPQEITLSYKDEKISMRRIFHPRMEQYSVDELISIEVAPGVAPPPYLFFDLKVKKEIGELENERREMIVDFTKSHSAFDFKSFDKVKEDVSPTHWVGFSSRYFLNALVDTSPGSEKPQFQGFMTQEGDIIGSLAYKMTSNRVDIPLRYYFGPKHVETLKAASPRLATAVDFGWFTMIAYPLLQGMKWIYNYVKNFGLAIILLTIFVKLITYPLTYKSMKSMKEMQKIQPQIAKLKEKYGDDKEALNREMMQLMRSHGYNPMSGCLPMLIQMPIYVALYNVLNNSIELYGQPFFGWIHDLSQKDPYFVTPVLLGVVMFLQQKMTPTTTTDPAQQKMMMMMPLIFSFMMLWLPSGLTLYMLINSIVSIGQQLLINKTIASKA